MTRFDLKLLDSRRLTGPNLFWDKSGAIIDVAIKGIDTQKLITVWKKHCRVLLNALGWKNESINSRTYTGGASLVISAPIDCLYAATEITEAALQLSLNEFNATSNQIERILDKLRGEINKEKNPRLINLQEVAAEHNVKFLSDDEHVSLGYGKTCQIFNVTNIPKSNQINWQDIKDIPVALITGTNGKSTTVRLASSVVKAAGKKCGVTSTDYIRVADKILDAGDYSGPGGARTLLRHPDCEIALLEVARGGMLRRGLGVNQATTVVVTNVAEDHLGEYGINCLSDMVETKFIVRQAINHNQNLILNADDAGCVKFARSLNNKIVWFSWYEDNPIIANHIKKGGSTCYVENNIIYYHNNKAKQQIIHINEIPITFSGAAKHNIHNALAVVALSHSLGFNTQSIAQGLKDFTSTPENNPGRGNLFEFNGIRVIADFAHNEHGLNLMARTIKNMPAKRRLVLIGQAGDRSDSLIKGLVKSALHAKPDTLVICEMQSHLRGRKLGEIPKIIHKFALKQGMKEEQLIHAKDTIDGTRKALKWSRQGDLLLILALTNRSEIIEILNSKM